MAKFTKEFIEILSERSMENQCPPMLPYFFSGAVVLDACCGPGTVALDVADKIRPGTLKAIDISDEMLGRAREYATERKTDNVEFLSMDGADPNFSDDTFDLVYSLNAFQHFEQPEKVLKEWRRITKPGGWVMTNLVGEGHFFIYPDCPSFLKTMAVRRTKEGNGDIEQDRKAVELLHKAGFRDIEKEMYSAPMSNVHKDSQRFEMIYRILMHIMRPEINENRELLKTGLLAESTLIEAQREIEAWQNHPHAVFMRVCLFVAGRVH